MQASATATSVPPTQATWWLKRPFDSKAIPPKTRTRPVPIRGQETFSTTVIVGCGQGSFRNTGPGDGPNLWPCAHFLFSREDAASAAERRLRKLGRVRVDTDAFASGRPGCLIAVSTSVAASPSRAELETLAAEHWPRRLSSALTIRTGGETVSRAGAAACNGPISLTKGAPWRAWS
jgi:hypothetical protein